MENKLEKELKHKMLRPRNYSIDKKYLKKEDIERFEELEKSLNENDIQLNIRHSGFILTHYKISEILLEQADILENKGEKNHKISLKLRSSGLDYLKSSIYEDDDLDDEKLEEINIDNDKKVSQDLENIINNEIHYFLEGLNIFNIKSNFIRIKKENISSLYTAMKINRNMIKLKNDENYYYWSIVQDAIDYLKSFERKNIVINFKIEYET
jgi:hypothetical protein